MTTNLDVDLRQLFVMPNLCVRIPSTDKEASEACDDAELMQLTAARELFGGGLEEKAEKPEEEDDDSVTALEQVDGRLRNVLVGAPGSGKSTFLVWLQIMVASAEEELILGDGQATPLLLRMRELDPKDLPRRAALIEKATASKDRADLMPAGWIDRQMEAGRVLFILDGLDETEPELRDRYVFPWLAEICADYTCRVVKLWFFELTGDGRIGKR